MTSNDWAARLVSGVATFQHEEAKGQGSIARFVAKDIAPYIGVRIQEGAMVWRPDSDEACKDVINDILEQMEANTTKGLAKGTKPWLDVRNAQSFTKRAVRFYRAITILADKTGEAADMSKTQPLFPVAWFVPNNRIRVIKSKSVMMLPISGKTVHAMKLETDTDEDESFSFTVSESSILRVAFPATKREASQTDASDDTTPAPEMTLDILPGIVAKMAADEGKTPDPATLTVWRKMCIEARYDDAMRAIALEVFAMSDAQADAEHIQQGNAA